MSTTGFAVVAPETMLPSDVVHAKEFPAPVLSEASKVAVGLLQSIT